MCLCIYICIIYNFITLLYTWSQHNIVTYLSFNKNGFKKQLSHFLYAYNYLWTFILITWDKKFWSSKRHKDV